MSKLKHIKEFKQMDLVETLSERIKSIKRNNSGKFDHLPDPKKVGAFDHLSEDESDWIEKKLKLRFEGSKNS